MENNKQNNALIDSILADAPSQMQSVRDFLRLAVSLFNRAGLAYGHGTTNALDEAAFIILETLSLPIDQLDPYLDARLSAVEARMLSDIIARRIQTRKPASYLLNRAYIQNIPFYVDERVIVPRSFIGEILCGEDAPAFLDNLPSAPRVLDMCTGSGCLAILAAHIFPDAEIDAVDLSPDALDVARINIDNAGLQSRIHLAQSDLFAALNAKTYDLIIANPPYVRRTVVEGFPAEHMHEPTMAHIGGEDGLDIVRRIIDDAPAHLNPDGGLLCEIGTDAEIIDRDYPHMNFLWLDTTHSEGEVFWIVKEDMHA